MLRSTRPPYHAGPWYGPDNMRGYDSQDDSPKYSKVGYPRPRGACGREQFPKKGRC